MLVNEPPFELGETLQGTALDDVTVLINEQWLGAIYTFPAKPYRTSGIGDAMKRRNGRAIKAIAIRNVSGQTLYGKRLVALDYATAGLMGCHTTKGYTVATKDKNCVIVDEFLSGVGVADDDIFWGILEGPVIVKTQTLAAASTHITVGSKVTAGSGAGTLLNLTSGGIGISATPEVDTLIGTAMSATTSGNTYTDVLINACILSY